MTPHDRLGTFSRRLPPRTDINELTRMRHALQAAGAHVVDLTASNPTTANLPYPPDILAPLSDRRAGVYEPQPLGLAVAREAIAADCARRGAAIDPADVIVSASTSEAYSWLFKLLCDPGDTVLIPRPSYPLFEHLARLDGVETWSYPLHYQGRWEIDLDALAQAPAQAKALVLVTPNNPTGSYVSAEEFASLVQLCRDRGWALVADEVFADYPLEAAAPLTDLAMRAPVLAFSLGGASKTLGLPQVKLGWMIAGGPPEARRAARAGLELIADTYLSVSTPVQLAAPELLRRGASVRAAIHDRIRENLARARAIAACHPACEVLRVDGGWSAVVRVPATRPEEELALALLERERVLVHPGYFFDFAHEAFFVVSLLPRPDVFADALERVVRLAAS